MHWGVCAPRYLVWAVATDMYMRTYVPWRMAQGLHMPIFEVISSLFLNLQFPDRQIQPTSRCLAVSLALLAVICIYIFPSTGFKNMLLLPIRMTVHDG